MTQVSVAMRIIAREVCSCALLVWNLDVFYSEIFGGFCNVLHTMYMGLSESSLLMESTGSVICMVLGYLCGCIVH